MNHWFISFSYRKNPDSSILFGNAVISTITKHFSHVHIQQEIADKNNFSDVVMLNWKEMTQLEYMGYQNWMDSN